MTDEMKPLSLTRILGCSLLLFIVVCFEVLLVIPGIMELSAMKIAVAVAVASVTVFLFSLFVGGCKRCRGRLW